MPLVLKKNAPYDRESDLYSLKHHASDPSIKDQNLIREKNISPKSLIKIGKDHKPKLLI